MACKHFKPEKIIAKLRQVEVLPGQAMSAAVVARLVGATQWTYCRWRRLCDGSAAAWAGSGRSGSKSRRRSASGCAGRSRI